MLNVFTVYSNSKIFSYMFALNLSLCLSRCLPNHVNSGRHLESKIYAMPKLSEVYWASELC